MEQLYSVEIFLDKVTLFIQKGIEEETKDKDILLVVDFLPDVQFIFKKGEILEQPVNDGFEKDELGRLNWTKVIQVGKSYVFSEEPNTLVQILSKYHIESSVWTDYEGTKEYIGAGKIFWDTELMNLVRKSANVCAASKSEPVTVNLVVPVTDECCCQQVGNVAMSVKLSAFGAGFESTFTAKENETFHFSPGHQKCVLECKVIEEHKAVYDIGEENKEDKKAICVTEKTCDQTTMFYCDKHIKKLKTGTNADLKTIKLGQILGLCGNAYCPLAQKIRRYLRGITQAQIYQGRKLAGTDLDKPTKVICGKCICRKDVYREDPISELNKTGICGGCGGFAHPGVTCKEVDEALFGVKVDVEPTCGGDCKLKGEDVCKCKQREEDAKPKCCKSANCECPEHAIAAESRKAHRPYCPAFTHKDACPISKADEEEDLETVQPVKSLPFGMEPLLLGPCPIIGKPCAFKDGPSAMHFDYVRESLKKMDVGLECTPKHFELVSKYIRLREHQLDEREKVPESADKPRICCAKHMLGR